MATLHSWILTECPVVSICKGGIVLPPIIVGHMGIIRRRAFNSFQTIFKYRSNFYPYGQQDYTRNKIESQTGERFKTGYKRLVLYVKDG